MKPNFELFVDPQKKNAGELSIYVIFLLSK